MEPNILKKRIDKLEKELIEKGYSEEEINERIDKIVCAVMHDYRAERE